MIHRKIDININIKLINFQLYLLLLIYLIKFRFNYINNLIFQITFIKILKIHQYYCYTG
jgi:hypothetical protein